MIGYADSRLGLCRKGVSLVSQVAEPPEGNNRANIPAASVKLITGNVFQLV